MGEDDYDDAALMQIDMCERNAPCEAENEPPIQGLGNKLDEVRSKLFNV